MRPLSGTGGSRVPWSSIRNALWLTPAAFVAVLTGMAVALLLAVSFGRIEIGTTRVPEIGTAWELVFSEPAFWIVAARSLALAVAVSAITVIVSYLTSLSVATVRSRAGVMAIYALIVTPLIVSVVVRVYAWELIFGAQGIVTNVLVAIGFTDSGTNLLSNGIGVGFVFVVSALPIAFFPIHAALQKNSKEFNEASATLGSTKFRSFFDITLPLTLPSALVASQLVFIATIGSFGIPALVGRGKVQTIAAEVWQSTAALNWVRASILVIVLLVIGLAAVALVSLLTRRAFAVGSEGK